MYLHPAIINDLSAEVRAEHIRRATRRNERPSRRHWRSPQLQLARDGPLHRLRLLRA